MGFNRIEYPSGYVARCSENLKLTLMNADLFPDYFDDNFDVKLNFGINENMMKYQVSLKPVDDGEALVLDSVKDLSTGKGMSLTGLLGKHGAEDGDVVIVTHDANDYYRFFVHKSK